MTILDRIDVGGRRVLAALVVLASGVGGLPASAQAPKPPTASPAASAPDASHRRDDVVRHRAIAAAHEAAARCLESGKPESACHDALRKACEGLAVGRYCGMKHVH
jgi:hypothetical protein